MRDALCDIVAGSPKKTPLGKRISIVLSMVSFRPCRALNLSHDERHKLGNRKKFEKYPYIARTEFAYTTKEKKKEKKAYGQINNQNQERDANDERLETENSIPR